MSFLPVPPVMLIGREPRPTAEANMLRWMLLSQGGPGWVVAHEVWRLATRYRVVSRDDLQAMIDSLERFALDQQVALRVTEAQRAEIETLTREIALVEEQRSDHASRIAELADRIRRLLDGLSGEVA